MNITEGTAIFMGVLGMMALVPTIAAFALKEATLAIIGVLFWVILSVFAATQIGAEGDIMWGIFIGSFFMGIMSGYAAFNTRKKGILEGGGEQEQTAAEQVIAKRQAAVNQRNMHRAVVMGHRLSPQRRQAMETKQIMRGVTRQR